LNLTLAAKVSLFLFFKNILFTRAYFWLGPQVGAGDGHRVQEQGRVVDPG
jgi:hypothetical protein